MKTFMGNLNFLQIRKYKTARLVISPNIGYPAFILRLNKNPNAEKRKIAKRSTKKENERLKKNEVIFSLSSIYKDLNTYGFSEAFFVVVATAANDFNNFEEKFSWCIHLIYSEFLISQVFNLYYCTDRFIRRNI